MNQDYAVEKFSQIVIKHKFLMGKPSISTIQSLEEETLYTYVFSFTV
jgi:hypothetical protein